MKGTDVSYRQKPRSCWELMKFSVGSLVVQASVVRNHLVYLFPTPPFTEMTFQVQVNGDSIEEFFEDRQE